MRRPTAALLLAVLLGLWAAPAQAAFNPIEQTWATTNASMVVDSKANINRDGSAVDWQVKFTCPVGEQYVLSTFVSQLNPPSIPDLAGEDYGVSARGTNTGTCTGKNQSVKAHLLVFNTSWFDRTLGISRSEYVPIGVARAPFTAVQADIQDANGFPGDFFALYCAAPSCAGETGSRVSLVK